MQLIEFRVQKYKCFDDSGWIKIENLTVLVGKNEAGKTSLLKALHRLNPFKGEEYKIENDWPRGQRRNRDTNQVVCSAKFLLSDEEKETLCQKFKIKIEGDKLLVNKNYNNELDFELDHTLLADSPTNDNQHFSEEIGTDEADVELDKLSNIDDLTLRLKELLPTFIYMSDYRDFSGSSRLDQILERKNLSSLTEEDKTILMLMDLSGLELEKEVNKGNQEDRIERQYDLDDASNTLTNTIEDRWRQKKYEVQFRADGQNFFTFIKDGADLIKLEERSSGFQWFFSFDLMFMYESQGTFKNCVILLDEPGLHLHPEGQTDLLIRLKNYAQENTLIYSTHLPFMIDLEMPESIRVVAEIEGGVRVTEDITETQKESKLVLQAALGISGRQSYLISSKNFIVEGVDDFWYLSELSSLCKRFGKEGFDEEIFITPAGGAPEAVYITTFMIGQKLDTFVLLDADVAGRTAKDKLEKNWLTKYNNKKSKVYLLNEILDEKTELMSIEDIFPVNYYLDKVKIIYENQLKAKDNFNKLTLPKGKDMLCKKVERELEKYSITFNKGSVAKLIRKDILNCKSLDELPEGVLDKFSKIVTVINTFFISSTTT